MEEHHGDDQYFEGDVQRRQNLAERVAERLGYPCLGREEVLIEAGKEYGVSERELTEAVNQPPPFWQQVPGRRVAYLMCLTATLLKQARQETWFITGMQATSFLRGSLMFCGFE